MRIEYNIWLILASCTLLLLVSSAQINHIFGEVVDGPDFSVEVPESWIYTVSPESSIKDLLGEDSFSSLVLAPVEFGTFLIEQDDIEMGNGSAAIVFAKDYDYSLKNAPLDLYVKFKSDRDDSLNITSKQNTTVDNEKAVTIEGIKNDISGDIRMLDYLVIHEDEPYHFRYIASVNDFAKKLPEFEAMVNIISNSRY